MSKVSREQAQQNRDHVVETAARLFRERGFDGVGISNLMKAAGLTHGGFYANFSSKEHLMAEALKRACEQFDLDWSERLSRAGPQGLTLVASVYLSKDHRDQPATGCAMAALGVDASHHGARVRSAFTAGAKRFFDLLLPLIPGRSQKARRREAITSVAAMLGALVLARGVNDEDLSDEILEAVRAHVTNIGAATRS